MSELILLPDETILDQSGGDFGSGFTMTPGNCIVTNQRLVICSFTTPREDIDDAISGVGAKILIGDVADIAASAISMAKALKSEKPLYPVYVQRLDNLTCVSPYRWGLGCGVRIKALNTPLFKVKLGLGRTRDKWIAKLKDVIEANFPQTVVTQSNGSLMIISDRNVDNQSQLDSSSSPKNIWILNMGETLISIHRIVGKKFNPFKRNRITYELRVDGNVESTEVHLPAASELWEPKMDAIVHPENGDDFLIRAYIHEPTRNVVAPDWLPGDRWFRLAYLQDPGKWIDETEESTLDLRSCSKDEYNLVLKQRLEAKAKS